MSIFLCIPRQEIARTFVQKLELDGSCKDTGTAVADDLGPKWTACHKGLREVLIGDIGGQIRNVKQRFV